jgi:hypothetical protein
MFMYFLSSTGSKRLYRRKYLYSLKNGNTPPSLWNYSRRFTVIFQPDWLFSGLPQIKGFHLFACIKAGFLVTSSLTLWHHRRYYQNYSVFTDKLERNCHRDIIFSASYNVGKSILFFYFFGSNTWLVSGKSCSAWQWVMQFLLGARKWHWWSGLSVNALYYTIKEQTS